MKRRVVAIGDLHGDVQRLRRILEEKEIVVAGKTEWSRGAQSVDLVLLGDYVDWRGEPLEGNKAYWSQGVSELMEVVVKLYQSWREVRSTSKFNSSRFFPLLGNHDKMMLDSYRFLAAMSSSKRDMVAGSYQDAKRLLQILGMESSKSGGFLSGIFGARKTASVEDTLQRRFRVWLANGGVSTLQSYGGMAPWYERMSGGLADFIDTRMQLGVVLNGRLYSHSVPDDARFWRPLDQIAKLPADEKDAAVEEWVWGRKIWGFDYNTGKTTDKPATADVDKMLAALQVKGVVVGHSLMQSLYPIKAYGGKVVNIDLHGHPLSEPWLDEYEE